jgi:hypothetical protein
MRADERDRDRETPGRENEKVKVFSEYVDRLMEERGEIPAELGGMMTVAAWLTERGEEPEPPFAHRLEDSLHQQWTAQHGAPRAPRRGWWPWPRFGRARWRALAAALAALLLLGSVSLLSPRMRSVVARTVEDGIEIVLERASVREMKPQRQWELPPSQIPTYASVREAQERVDFHIREPAYLPPSPSPGRLRLEGVQVADGSAVLVGYRREREGQGIELLYISQSPVMEGEDVSIGCVGKIQEIDLRGHRAVWCRDRRRRNSLFWQDGDLLFGMYGTLPLEEMEAVAVSLFEE